MFLFILGCSLESKDSQGGVASGTLDVLTYNIHALPSAVTGDDTPSRLTQIAPLLRDFDLIGIQEDWMDEYHPILLDGAAHPYVDRFDIPLDDEKVYGAGLSFLGKSAIVKAQHIYYESCFGFLDNASDCFASKGLQFLEIDVDGNTFHFYNTHLEAGGGPEDQEVRAQQIDKIRTVIEQQSTNIPVILMGDFNLEPDKEEEDLLLAQLREEAGLTLTCTQVNCAEPNHIDQIYIRMSSDIQFEVVSWERREEFVDPQGVPLSDHPAIMTTIRWERSGQ